jgi:cell division protease FtsH
VHRRGGPFSQCHTSSASESTAALIDAEVRRILQEHRDEAVRLLSEHRHELDALAEALLEHETLEEEILVVTGLRRVTETVSAPPTGLPASVNGVAS